VNGDLVSKTQEYSGQGLEVRKMPKHVKRFRRRCKDLSSRSLIRGLAAPEARAPKAFLD
jgi:hypothetical protein